MQIKVTTNSGPIAGGKVSIDVKGDKDWDEETLDSLTVTFGNVPATDVEVTTEWDYRNCTGTISVTSPPWKRGETVPVTAITLGDQKASDNFTYKGGEITSIVPNQASVADVEKGIVVIINGTQFGKQSTDVTAVAFGTHDAEPFNWISDCEVWVRVPKLKVNASTPVAVSVKTRGQTITLNNAFTYLPK